MKDAEDEAFDEIARRQGAWGGGFPAKRAMAADKLQEPIYKITVFDNAHPKGIPFEDWVQPAQEPDMQTGIAYAYQKGFHDGKQAALAQAVQEQWKCVGPPCKCNASNAKQCCYAVFTKPPLPVQREWVGLTDEEMYFNCPNWLSQEQCKVWLQQIEAKLKGKNNGT